MEHLLKSKGLWKFVTADEEGDCGQDREKAFSPMVLC
jgi:hypothetical protein